VTSPEQIPLKLFRPRAKKTVAMKMRCASLLAELSIFARLGASSALFLTLAGNAAGCADDSDGDSGAPSTGAELSETGPDSGDGASSSSDSQAEDGEDTGDTSTDDGDGETGEPPEGYEEDGPGEYPAVPHLIAIGDVHGDGYATIDVLKAAGVIDDSQNWIGGTTWVVQTGDQLDRGYQEEEIMMLFEHLRGQAAEAGGRFLALNGNHEVMMTEGRMDYVFDEEAFGGLEARIEAFAPGGPWAQILAKRNIIARVGDTVFVHGGILPNHAEEGMLNINADAKAWFLGDLPNQPDSIDNSGSVVWTRAYSDDDELSDADACALLDETLAIMGASRLVVAHTVQDFINSRCDGKVWRIDSGMSDYYGGNIEALEIVDDTMVSVIMGN
jgi:hypothetical protein